MKKTMMCVAVVVWMVAMAIFSANVALAGGSAGLTIKEVSVPKTVKSFSIFTMKIPVTGDFEGVSDVECICSWHIFYHNSLMNRGETKYPARLNKEQGVVEVDATMDANYIGSERRAKIYLKYNLNGAPARTNEKETNWLKTE